MTSVLHRRTPTSVVDRAPLPTPGVVPQPDPGSDGRPAPWPTGAKVIVGLLIVATVLGLIGSAIGLASGDDTTERQLRGQVADLIEQRDVAIGDVADLDAELATLQQQLQAAQADSDRLGDQNDALGARVDELEGQIATLGEARDAALGQAVDLEARLAAMTGERDLALDSADQMKAALATAQQRLATAVAERDALAGRFPVTFDTPLANVVTPGKYGVKATEIYCAGMTSCGKAPAFSELTITKSADGFLRLSVPNFVDGGLYRAAGALHMATVSNTAVPACDGVARSAVVAITMLPGSYSLDAKGATSVAGLSAVVTIEAPATGNCPAVLAFSSATLTARV